MKISLESATTRSEIKQAIISELRVMFTKGFAKWWNEGGADTNYFKEALEEKPINLRAGRPGAHRRFYYFCEVHKAFKRFVNDLAQAEEWLTADDLDEVASRRRPGFREVCKLSYKSSYGRELSETDEEERPAEEQAKTA